MEIEIELESEIEYLERTEDKLINEILCYWDESKSKWKEYSKKELTAKFLDEQMVFDDYIKRVITSEDQWH